MKKSNMIMGLSILLLGVAGCSSKNEEPTANQAETNQSTATKNSTTTSISKANDGKDLEGYNALLKKAESMASDGDYLEASDLIVFAQNEPFATDEGQAAIAQGEDYVTQLKTLDFLDKEINGESTAGSGYVRSESNAALDLKNGSKKLNNLIEEKRDEYFDLVESGKLEEQAQKRETAQITEVEEGYQPTELADIEFTKGINQNGEVMANTGNDITIEGTYSGNGAYLALISSGGRCFETVDIENDGSFKFDIDLSNSDFQGDFDVVPTSGWNVGDSNIVVGDSIDSEYCTIKTIESEY